MCWHYVFHPRQGVTQESATYGWRLLFMHPLAQAEMTLCAFCHVHVEGEWLSGGFFDNSTSPEDRRKYLLGIMQAASQDEGSCSLAAPTPTQVCNAWLRTYRGLGCHQDTGFASPAIH